MTEHPLLNALNKVQYDLTALKATVSEIQRQVAALDLTIPERPACPHCGLTFKGSASLAEHVYHSHDGAYPEHWAKAEQLAQLDDR